MIFLKCFLWQIFHAYIFSGQFGIALAAPQSQQLVKLDTGLSVEWGSKADLPEPPKPSRAGKGWAALETCTAQLRPHLEKQLLPRPAPHPNSPILHSMQPSFQLSRLAGSPSKQDLTATLKPHPRTGVPWGVEQVWYDVKERKFQLDAEKPDMTPHSVLYNSLVVDALCVGALTEHCPDKLWRNFSELLPANK